MDKGLEAVQLRLQPGEALEDSPHWRLHLAQTRCFVSKIIPGQRHVSVAEFRYRDIVGVRVQAGNEIRAKKKQYWTEIGTTSQPASGLGTGLEPQFRFSNGQGNAAAALADYYNRPNVIACGKGADGLAAANAVVAALESRRGADEQSADTRADRAGASTGPSDPVERLTKLASLLDAGLLTRDEFDAQKVTILQHG